LPKIISFPSNYIYKRMMFNTKELILAGLMRETIRLDTTRSMFTQGDIVRLTIKKELGGKHEHVTYAMITMNSKRKRLIKITDEDVINMGFIDQYKFLNEGVVKPLLTKYEFVREFIKNNSKRGYRLDKLSYVKVHYFEPLGEKKKSKPKLLALDDFIK